MNENKNGTGINFLEALQLIFITLKLTGTIDWSWQLVFLPTTIPIAMLVVIFIIGKIKGY